MVTAPAILPTLEGVAFGQPFPPDVRSKRHKGKGYFKLTGASAL